MKTDFKEALLKSLQQPASRAPAWTVEEMTSRPMSSVKLSKASEASEASPLPIPHGSVYDSLHTLTIDVMNRCQCAGLSLATTLRILKQVALQFEGGALQF